MNENSVFVVFNIVSEWVAIVINCPNCLFGAKVIVDNCYWLNYNLLNQLEQILILVHLLHVYLDQHLFL